jgi:hypothetical protein
MALIPNVLSFSRRILPLFGLAQRLHQAVISRRSSDNCAGRTKHYVIRAHGKMESALEEFEDAFETNAPFSEVESIATPVARRFRQ